VNLPSSTSLTSLKPSSVLLDPRRRHKLRLNKLLSPSLNPLLLLSPKPLPRLLLHLLLPLNLQPPLPMSRTSLPPAHHVLTRRRKQQRNFNAISVDTSLVATLSTKSLPSPLPSSIVNPTLRNLPHSSSSPLRMLLPRLPLLLLSLSSRRTLLSSLTRTTSSTS